LIKRWRETSRDLGVGGLEAGEKVAIYTTFVTLIKVWDPMGRRSDHQSHPRVI
jgi:hypothetical protein